MIRIQNVEKNNLISATYALMVLFYDILQFELIYREKNLPDKRLLARIIGTKPSGEIANFSKFKNVFSKFKNVF